MKAFEDGVTYEATKILEDNVAGGTGTHAQIGCPQGGKTGTTDHNIDAWFVGFTPRLATAVWVGFPGDARVSMNGMYRPTGGNIDGGTYPADIWGEYMKKAVGKFCGGFPKPKQPFVSQPFFGHYSREGLKSDEDKDNDRPERHPDRRAPDSRPRPARTTAPAGRRRRADRDRPEEARDRQHRYNVRPEPVRDPASGRRRTAGGGTKAPGDG